MPEKESLITTALRGVRAFGLSTAVQVAVYPLRRAYYEAKFSQGGPRGSVLRGIAAVLGPSRRPAPEQRLQVEGWTSVGNVVSQQQDGQVVTVHCENATVRLTVLAEDLLRVQLSHGAEQGRSAAAPAYAVCRPDSDWPPATCTLAESEDAIELRTGRLVCRIARRPCRLTFCDLQGNPIHADSAGLAWQGRQVARFAALAPDEQIHGLGARAFPLDLRGRSYTLWNTDPQDFNPGRDPLYLSIPFYVGLHAGQSYGLFYDNTYRAQVDLGATDPGQATYRAEDGELSYYFFGGPTLTAVLERYTELTGRMAMPPLWALGYQQSRWSYYPEARVREIARLLREHRIPCDVLYLDIHYMNGYRAFTWDSQRFPDPARLLSDLREQGLRVVLAVDPHIKADRHYAVCTDGLRRGVFCTYPDGGVAAGPVWPGEAYFPDFTSPRARQWWGDLFGSLLQAGVAGIWNDMDEPTAIATQNNTLANCVRHDWEGQGTDHRQAHNAYGLLTARSTAEGLRRLRDNERPFVLTRSGWAGVQRYGAHWTGDNLSTWEHLRLTVPMVLNLGLSGLAFTGADVGGFDGDAEAELMVRWLQMGAFLPLFRNHSSIWSRNQEPWIWGEPYVSANRAAIEQRYRLLPYLYTAMWQCSQKGTPVARPLVWAYPDDAQAATLDDEFLCGDGLLVAPVGQPGQTSRQVRLPAGEWFDFWSGERHTGPDTVTVAAPLERIPLFVRAGTVLPTWPVMQHTGERPVDRLILHVYAGEGQSWLYEDDGQSMAYARGEMRVTRYECQRTGEDKLAITCHREGPYRPAYTHCEWHIHGLAVEPEQVLMDGEAVQGLAWDQPSHTLRLDSGEVQRIEIR